MEPYSSKEKTHVSSAVTAEHTYKRGLWPRVPVPGLTEAGYRRGRSKGGFPAGTAVHTSVQCPKSSSTTSSAS